MELKQTNLKAEIVLARKLNFVELLFFENFKNLVSKRISYVIFSRWCYDSHKWSSITLKIVGIIASSRKNNIGNESKLSL